MPTKKPLTVVDGDVEFVATRSGSGSASATQYGNRTQAQKKAAKLGGDWEVYHRGHFGFKVGRKISKTKKLHFYAIRIDETRHWNMDVVRKELGGYAPSRIWGMYVVCPEQHVHIASLTPSCRADFVGNRLEFDNLPDELMDRDTDESLNFWDKVGEAEISTSGDDDTYFDTRDVERIIKGPNACDLGLYESEDEDDRDAWDAVREHELGNPSF